MVAIPQLPVALRLVACFACFAISASVVSAQDKTMPQPIRTDSRYIPAGYYPDNNFSWPPGRPAEVLRPLPPGYVAPPTGNVNEDCFQTPPRHFHIWSRSCGCLSRSLSLHCQEKQSFHMYIRGNGPAIHSRPGSIWW